MVTEKEARKKAERAIKDRFYKNIAVIESAIELEIAKGKTSICMEGSISSDVKQYLQQLGYEVDCASQYNEPYFKVKW